MMTRSALILLLLFLTEGCNSVFYPNLKAETIKGCYRLELSAWKPNLHLAQAEMKYITPPSRIELSLEHQRNEFDPKNDDFQIYPATPTEGSIHQLTGWKVNQNRFIDLYWSTGFSGLSMRLHQDKNYLRGTAYTFWDFGRTQQTADVVAIPISCPIVGGIPK
jgi:hypothetical protein